jgi:hypothetical protein
MDITTIPDYDGLLQRIVAVYDAGRVRAVQAVNVQLLETYWHVGRHIVEFEQGGQARAEYGASLISRLAKDLRIRQGKGFDRSNLIRMRQFYLAYPKGATPSHLLSWSHVVELLKIDDPLERGFYEKQMLAERCQMNLYLGYFAAEENAEGDAEPIGIILSRHKDELLVQYATYGMNSQLFVQKYQLYLPDQDELRRELELTLQDAAAKEKPKTEKGK